MADSSNYGVTIVLKVDSSDAKGKIEDLARALRGLSDAEIKDAGKAKFELTDEPPVEEPTPAPAPKHEDAPPVEEPTPQPQLPDQQQQEQDAQMALQLVQQRFPSSSPPASRDVTSRLSDLDSNISHETEELLELQSHLNSTLSTLASVLLKFDNELARIDRSLRNALSRQSALNESAPEG